MAEQYKQDYAFNKQNITYHTDLKDEKFDEHI